MTLKLMGSFLGEATHLFPLFLSLLSWGSALKKKTLLAGSEQVLSFVSGSLFFERAALCRKADRSLELSPFVQMIGNNGGVLIHLNSLSMETLGACSVGATSKLALAQPGVEPALMALFQRDVHQFVTPYYQYCICFLANASFVLLVLF